MAERIEYPPELQGEAEDRIRQIHRYLRKIVEQLNTNQSLTDENLSEYIASQANALRNITGAEAGEQKTDVRDLAAELVDTMTNMLKELQNAKANTVTTSSFPTEFARSARQTPVAPTGSSTTFVIANAIKALQDAKTADEAKLGKVMDATGLEISDNWHGFIYSGVLYLNGDDDPVYGVGIGKDVVTWTSGGTPVYNRSNAWLEIAEDGSEIGGSAIATAEDLASKLNKNATYPLQTDANQITMSGKYAILVDVQTLTNFPSTLTDGEVILLEVDGDGINTLLQRIWTNGKIYTRAKASGAWAGWNVFNGTAV